MSKMGNGALALIFSAAAALSLQYYSAIDLPLAESRQITHTTIIDGSAANPYRYRVLAPFLVEAAIRLGRALELDPERSVVLRSLLFEHPAESGTGLFLLTYAVFEFLSIGAGLYSVFRVCALFFPPGRALLGALLAGLAMSVTFRDHYFQPWSLLELPLFGFGCLAIFRGQNRALLLIVALAALNRETSVFLLVIFFFTKVYTDSGFNRSMLLPFAVLTAAWLAVFLGLRWARGYIAPEFTMAMAWRYNTQLPHLIRAVFLNAILFGASWIYIALGVSRAPAPVRRAAFAIVPYLGLLLVMGYWMEVRYWIAMLPLLIPLLLSGAPV